MYPSHRLRHEERRLFQKIILTLFLFLAAGIFFFTLGLPALTRLIAFLSFGRVEQKTTKQADSEFSFLLPPVLDPLPEATNSAKIKISGYGEKESTIVVLVNSAQQNKTLVDKEGKFVTSLISLKEGENLIQVKAVKEDKESTFSSPLIVFYKKTPPKLLLNSPSEGEKFYFENKEITLSGETEIGNKVFINDHYVIVDNEGKFSQKVVLTAGENVFKVKAIDIAGNETTIERKVQYFP